MSTRPVLTLRAAVVAERLGHPPDSALSLASAMAGTAASAKAHHLGIAERRDSGKDTAPAKPRDPARLLGREVPLTHVAKAFGDRLDGVTGRPPV